MRKVPVKYVGPVVMYKIIGPHNDLLMTLDGKILRGLFEHERLKPANIRTSQGNVQNLVQNNLCMLDLKLKGTQFLTISKSEIVIQKILYVIKLNEIYPLN